LFYVYGKNGRFFSCRFISISSGVSALWGPLHGANQAVLEMLEEIHQNGGDVINIWQKPKIKTIL
jgi:citrate synthase